MNKIILLLLIFYNCYEATFTHPAEGAGGIIIGFVQTEKINILVSGNPESMDEGNTQKIGIKFSGQAEKYRKIKVSSNSPALLVNNSQEVELEFLSGTGTTEQQIELYAKPDGNSSSEEVLLEFSSEGISSLSIKILIHDNQKYNILVSSDSSNSLVEEATGKIGFSLGIKPEANVALNLANSDASSVTMDKSVLSFTPENYSTIQYINISINDDYNETKTYTFTATVETESKTHSVQLTDNDFSYYQVSSSQSNQYYSPTILQAEGSLYIAARNYSLNNTLTIYKCDSNGENCIFKNDSTGAGNHSALLPQIAYDATNQKIVIITSNRSSGSIALSLFHCSLDLSNCSHSVIANSSDRGGDPKLLLSAGKLYASGIDGSRSYLFICNLDGSGCSTVEMFEQANPGAGYLARGMFRVGDKIHIFFTGGYYTANLEPIFYVPVVKIFNTLDNSYETKYLSNIPRTGFGPSAIYRNSNNKILAVSNNRSIDGRLWLYSCDPSIYACDTFDLSANNPFASYYPEILFSEEKNLLYVLAYNSADLNHLYMNQCSLSVDNCKSVNISKGKTVYADQTEYHIKSIIDSSKRRLLTVFTEKDTGKLGLVRFGLGGF
ncbi:MAG: hypothetical protein H7A25_23925 [Leptospiraceae bacterium]|nr:hypothetical protein [Leptospiraceae bacterium]MCP5502971.1 hypothetical protein [Leptospiraceae bacterium]